MKTFDQLSTEAKRSWEEKRHPCRAGVAEWRLLQEVFFGSGNPFEAVNEFSDVSYNKNQIEKVIDEYATKIYRKNEKIYSIGTPGNQQALFTTILQNLAEKCRVELEGKEGAREDLIRLLRNNQEVPEQAKTLKLFFDTMMKIVSAKTLQIMQDREGKPLGDKAFNTLILKCQRTMKNYFLGIIQSDREIKPEEIAIETSSRNYQVIKRFNQGIEKLDKKTQAPTPFSQLRGNERQDFRRNITIGKEDPRITKETVIRVEDALDAALQRDDLFTEQQRRILDFIIGFRQNNENKNPSLKEIAEKGFGYSEGKGREAINHHLARIAVTLVKEYNLDPVLVQANLGFPAPARVKALLSKGDKKAER